MHARSPAHLSDDVLTALGSGKLSEDAVRTALAHLDACAECHGRAARLLGDLLQRARARTAWPSTVGHGTASATSAGPAPSTSQTGLPIPLELRDHEQYEIVRELGRGGMGVVYLARHRLTDRHEVLKVLVHDGDEVNKGDTVVLLEAMKMELPVRAAAVARVRAIHCRGRPSVSRL